MDRRSNPETDVFISYRRAGAGGYGHLLKDRVQRRQPGWSVFLDVESIDPGRDFVQVIDSGIGGVVLALVDREWIRTGDGRRRLDDPHDMVRFELERAFELGLPVLPVLLDSARMPTEDELPESLRWFARRNARPVRGDRVDHDMAAVIDAVEAEIAGRDGVIARAQLLDRDRRSRTVRLPLGCQLDFRTTHGPSNLLKVDGVRLDEAGMRVTRSGQLMVFRLVTYEFTVADGPRRVPVELRVRTLVDVQWIVGIEVRVDNEIVYTDGRPG